MEDPPSALPLLAAMLPPLSATAGSLTLPSTTSSTASTHTLAESPSPSKHVTQNPRVGDSGEVNNVAAAPLLQVFRPTEEDNMDDDSTSLSAICAR
jgi:hypothetical protein